LWDIVDQLKGEYPDRLIGVWDQEQNAIKEMNFWEYLDTLTGRSKFVYYGKYHQRVSEWLSGHDDKEFELRMNRYLKRGVKKRPALKASMHGMLDRMSDITPDDVPYLFEYLIVKGLATNLDFRHMLETELMDATDQTDTLEAIAKTDRTNRHFLRHHAYIREMVYRWGLGARLADKDGRDPSRPAGAQDDKSGAQDDILAVADFVESNALSRESFIESYREELAIFALGLYRAFKDRFGGAAELMIGRYAWGPKIVRDEITGRKMLALSEFRIALDEAREIAERHARQEKLLREKYIQGHAVALLLALRKEGREFESLAGKLDPFGLKRRVPAGFVIRRGVFEKELDEDVFEAHLRLLAVCLKVIHGRAPFVRFYLEGFEKDSELIGRVLDRTGTRDVILTGPAKESVRIVADMPRARGLPELPAVHLDFEAVGRQGVPAWHELYQGILEAAAFADPEKRVLDFESYDAGILPDLIKRRNRRTAQPIEDTGTYLGLVSGRASLTTRMAHILRIVIPVPVEYVLRSLKRSVLEVSRSM